MMASSNGSIFRFTGLLCGEFTGHRWIPHTKASDAELWCFLWSAPEHQQLSKEWRRRWFETPSRSLWRFCNDFVNIANGISNDVDGKIPPDYPNDESLIIIKSKYDSNFSILISNKKMLVSNVDRFNSLKLCLLMCVRHLWIWIPKKATGYDNITSSILKVGVLPLAGTLWKLITLLWQNVNIQIYWNLLRFRAFGTIQEIWYAL